MAKNTLLFGVITDILGKPKKVNQNKQQYSFDCPVCSAEKGLYDGDGKGNLEVNLSDGIFHCWACGQTHNTHGTLKKLFRKFGNKQQLETLKKLGYEFSEIKVGKKKKNVIEELELPETFIEFKDSNPKSLEHKQAWNYLTKQRKISEDIISKYRIGYTTGGHYANRIILPSYDRDGKLNYWVGRTYINQKPKYLNPDSDKEEIIFNECCLNWDSTIYIVEGPFDHIVVYNSIPILGKKISDKLMTNLLTKSTADIVILMDGDAWKDAKELYSKLNVGKLHGRIKVIKLKPDFDIAKINEDFGRDGVIEVMKSGKFLKESDL
jgi:DNA primase